MSWQHLMSTAVIFAAVAEGRAIASTLPRRPQTLLTLRDWPGFAVRLICPVASPSRPTCSPSHAQTAVPLRQYGNNHRRPHIQPTRGTCWRRASGTKAMAGGVITDRYHLLRLPLGCVAEVFAVLKPGTSSQRLFQLVVVGTAPPCSQLRQMVTAASIPVSACSRRLRPPGRIDRVTSDVARSGRNARPDRPGPAPGRLRRLPRR
jgi:hypothetical protein